MKAEWRYASALLRILWIRELSTVSTTSRSSISPSSSGLTSFSSCEASVGFQLVRASSIACDEFSSSVLMTTALLVCPAASAASSEVLYASRCDNRCIMGHKSVDSPRRVSTECRGFERLPGSGDGNGTAIGGVSV